MSSDLPVLGDATAQPLCKLIHRRSTEIGLDDQHAALVGRIGYPFEKAQIDERPDATEGGSS